MTIIEDTITRNRKFQEQRLKRVEMLKKTNAPAVLIEHEELISKMTIAEYEIFCEKMRQEDNKIISEYAKNNPVQKSIVDEIYNRVENLNYDYFTYSSNFVFLQKLDPLSFMSKDDFDHDLYDTFIKHAKELYEKKYLDRWTEDNKENEE